MYRLLFIIDVYKVLMYTFKVYLYLLHVKIGVSSMLILFGNLLSNDNISIYETSTNEYLYSLKKCIIKSALTGIMCN